MRIGKHTYKKNNLVLYTNPEYESATLRNEKNAFHPSVTNRFDAFQDISFLELDRLSRQGIPEETIYVCELLGKSCYKYLEYIELSQSEEGIQIVVEVNYNISRWSASMNLLSFAEELRNKVDQLCGSRSHQEALFDEDLVHLKFVFSMSQQMKQELKAFIQQFSRKLSSVHNDIFSKNAEEQLSLIGC